MLTKEQIEELIERSKDDRSIIVGSEVRQLASMALSHLANSGNGEGWKLVPEDCVTHLGDFKKACELAQQHTRSDGDYEYWQHQLDTIDNIEKALETLSPNPHG